MTLLNLVCEFYDLGRYWFFTSTLSILGLLAFIQLCWGFYRWVNDASTEWSIKHRNRKLIFGEFELPIVSITFDKDDVKEFYILIVVSSIASIIAGFIWPLAVTIVTCILFGQTLRGVLRFKRNVNRTLADKADKNHNHDDRYNPKMPDGAVNK